MQLLAETSTGFDDIERCGTSSREGMLQLSPPAPISVAAAGLRSQLH